MLKIGLSVLATNAPADNHRQPVNSDMAGRSFWYRNLVTSACW